MPRKKKTDKVSPEVIQDMLNRPFDKEFETPKTLWEALRLAESLIGEVNGYLATSPLVQDYANLFASRMGKEKGSFSVSFDPQVQFEGGGRTKKTAPPKTTSKATTKPRTSTPKKQEEKGTPKVAEPPKLANPSINEELLNLTQKAKEMKIDISDIADNTKAIKDRISLVEDMQVESSTPEKQEEEIIVINPTKRRKKKVRVMGITPEGKPKKSLGGVRGLIDNIGNVSLEAVSDSVSQKHGIREDGK